MSKHSGGEVLTKSDLQALLQCPRKLWLQRNKRELLPEDDSGLNRRAMDGVIVGEQARAQLGANPVWFIKPQDGSAISAESVVKQLADNANRPAVEVPLLHGDVYTRADALVPRGGHYV